MQKHVFAKIDYEAKFYSLNYLQTKERHEVDFALVCDHQIEKMIEVKNSSSTIHSALFYFHNKYQLPGIQIVKELKQERVEQSIEILRAENFLKTLLV